MTGDGDAFGPDATTMSGISIASVLARVQGTHVASLTWGTQVTEVAVTPASGTTRLVVDVTPIDGGIRAFEPSANDGGEGRGAVCGPGFVTIAAAIRFVTDDHGFDENWTTELTTYTADTSATFGVDLTTMPIAGSFRATYKGTETWNTTELQLSGAFAARGTSGEVRYITSKTVATGPNTAMGEGLAAQVAAWVPVGADWGLAGDAADSVD